MANVKEGNKKDPIYVNNTDDIILDNLVDEMFDDGNIDPDEDDGKLYLTELELALINLNTEKHNIYKKDKAIIDMKKQIISVQKALIDSKKETLERDDMIIEYNAIQLSKDHESFKEISKKFLMDISIKHDLLKDKTWGYNPDTGEIIINE